MRLTLGIVCAHERERERESKPALPKIGICFVLLLSALNLGFPQIASATLYQPGTTLEPDCAPGSLNCGVVTYPSSLGTTTPIGNSLLTIEATTTNSILATLRGFAGQVANLFQVQDSAGVNVFSINASGGLTLGSLHGPLQANAGAVSATSSIGVLYGGTGLTAAPSLGQLLVGNATGGYTLTATSSLGLLTTNVAEGSNLYYTSNRVASVIAATTTTALAEGNNLYYTSSRVASVLAGTTTTALAEGSNLYYTTTRFDNRLSATTTLPNLTTLANLITTGALTSGSIGSGFGSVNIGANTFTGNGSGLTSLNANNLNNFGSPFYTFFSATTTDALTQGSTNKYYSDTLVNSYVHASSTVPKAYSTNTFTGANTFNGGLTVDTLNGPLQANAGLVSATSSVGVLYGGTGLTALPSYGQILRGTGTGYTLVATSTLGVDVSDTVGTLTVARGGTGATSFSQGWLYSTGDGNALSASTSPTVNYITATSTTATSTFSGGVKTNLLNVTSTTATSTFANGIDIIGGCFSKNGVCLPIGSDLQYVTSYKTNDTLTNITSATTTLTTVSITPTTATGDVVVRAGVTFTSSNATDQPVSIAIRQTNCTGTTLQSTLFTIASAAGAQAQHLDLNYVAVDPGASSQTYAFCISASAGDTDVSDWNMSAIVIDTGADVAEIYTTNDASLEAGDVVSLDPTLKTGVKKSTDASDRTVLGIVSTKPAMVIGGVEKEGVKAIPIALSGRVPVKVVTENGAIHPGDYLVPSSVSGVAMKARIGGTVIGQAMTAYSGAGVGTVLAFVKNFDLGAIEEVAVLMGDISPKVNPDGSDNGLSTLVATIQSETARNPVVIIGQKISDGKQFLTNFIAARVTAVRGYFDEVFAKKVHTEQLCIKKSDGSEICINGNQLQNSLNGSTNVSSADTTSGTSITTAASTSSASGGTADTEAPVVTIMGNNPARVAKGDTYIDLGATVTDNVNHNLGVHVAGDHIDTSVPGDYTVIYTATDQAGNVGHAERTVTVYFISQNVSVEATTTAAITVEPTPQPSPEATAGTAPAVEQSTTTTPSTPAPVAPVVTPESAP